MTPDILEEILERCDFQRGETVNEHKVFGKLERCQAIITTLIEVIKVQRAALEKSVCIHDREGLEDLKVQCVKCDAIKETDKFLIKIVEK